MPKASRLNWKIIFSHASSEELHRCFYVAFGGRSIHLCPRCLGLYPAMVLTAALYLARVTLPSSWTELVAIGLPVVGGTAWILERFGVELSKWTRLVSGVILGLGLGWVLGMHLRDPWPQELYEVGVAMTVVLVLGIIAELRGHHQEAPPISTLLEDAEEGELKKSDSNRENEVDPKTS